MKVGFYLSFPGGGIGRYSCEWLRAVRRIGGCDVELACLPNFQWTGETSCPVWSGLFGISHPFAPVRKARFLLGQAINPLRAIRHFRAAGVRIIHWGDFSHLSYPLWRKALAESDMKMAITVHDVRRQVAVLHRGYEDRQLREIYPRAAALFVHSEFQRDELVEFAGVDPADVVMVPHGPSSYGEPAADRASVRRGYGIPEDAMLGLCFGQIRDEKNLEGLLDAMALPGSRSHLLIAGTAGGRHRSADEYRPLVKRLGLEPRVVIDDRHIPDEEVAGVVTACDWVALPYLSTFTSQSGVLNIAAHYDRPVLSGAAPVLRETVTRQVIGIASAGDSVAELAEALRLLEGALMAGAHDFRFAAYRSANSWDENARITIGTYRRIADGCVVSNAGRSRSGP